VLTAGKDTSKFINTSSSFNRKQIAIISACKQAPYRMPSL